MVNSVGERVEWVWIQCRLPTELRDQGTQGAPIARRQEIEFQWWFVLVVGGEPPVLLRPCRVSPAVNSVYMPAVNPVVLTACQDVPPETSAKVKFPDPSVLIT